MYNAPKNEEIISEICEAEKFLKTLLAKLVDLNATPHTLRGIVEALIVLNNSYSEPHPQIMMPQANFIIRRDTPELPPEVKEQILAEMEKHLNRDDISNSDSSSCD